MGDQKLYVVEGQHDTDLEGMIFAVCTSRVKAEKALKMTCDGEDVQITEMTADSIILNGQIIKMEINCEDCSHYGEDVMHGAHCRFCSNSSEYEERKINLEVK